MATRAHVFRFSSPNTIEVAYNHSDGYPDGLGDALKTHYNDNTEVADLIGGGNWSYMDDESGDVSYYNEKPTVLQDDNMDELLFKLSDVVQGGDYAYMWDGEKWFTYKVGSRERFVADVANDMGVDIDTSDMMLEKYERKWKKFID